MPYSVSSNGYFTIHAGTRAKEFCPLINNNFERINLHSHDGLDSEKIKTFNLSKGLIDLDFSNWNDVNDEYVQNVTLPSGYTFEECSFTFICMSGAHIGKKLELGVSKVNTTTFSVHSSFNDINVRVVVI